MTRPRHSQSKGVSRGIAGEEGGVAVTTLPASVRGRIAELYGMHASRAAGLAYLLTGDAELAQDIVQEAFVRLMGRFQHIRNQDSFGFYLTKTVTNLSRNYLRRRRLEREREPLVATPGVVDPPSVEASDEIWRALLALPSRQRAAIALRFYEDFDEQQTAEVMGTSTSAVNSLVGRALRALREKGRLEAADEE